MKNTSWKDIAELIGMTAIVLSLIFVGLQLRQSQQLAQEEITNFSNERQNAIRTLIVEHAEIWHKACAGEPLDPVSRVIAGKIYDAWTDHVIAEYLLRATGIRQSEESREKIMNEMAAMFWIYPGLLDLARSRSDWHNGALETSVVSNEFIERLIAKRKEFEASGITPEMDTAWCGRT